MIIDFHTHIFPDSLAPKAMAALLANIDSVYQPVTDSTQKGLLAHMDRSGVALSVVQPVITKPSQFNNLNEFAAKVCGNRILSFGALHPQTDNYKRDIDTIVSLGLKGIKFHAEYQNFLVDDIKMLRIYDYAISRGLILLHHAGFDPGFRPPFKSSPRQFARIANELKGGTIIAAHYGGHAQWEEVLNHLAGTNVYLDTSMALDFMEEKLFLKILRAHGADKILFASDSPWGDPVKDMAKIRALPISETEKQNIFGENARKLLRI